MPEPVDMTIDYGDVVECEIEPVGDIDVYRFAGETGTTIVAQMVVGVFPDAFLELFRPDGTFFASASGGTTARIHAALDQSGTWTLLASEFGNTHAAAYTLALERVSPPSAAAAPFCMSDLMSGRIDPVGDLDAFRFWGESGNAIVAQMVVGVFPNAFLELFRPGGSLFGSASGGTTARIDAALDQTGTWTLIGSEFGNTDTADYTLALERVTPCAEGDDAGVTGETITDTRVAEACDTLYLGPSVAIVAPGKLRACAGESVVLNIDFSVQQDAEFAAVSGAFGTPVVFGSTVDGRLDPVGDLDAFRFSGVSGATIAAQMVVGVFPDAFLELFRPDGTFFAEASGGTTARIDATLDQSGAWTLLASEFGNTHTADYSLSLVCVSGCP